MPLPALFGPPLTGEGAKRMYMFWLLATYALTRLPCIKPMSKLLAPMCRTLPSSRSVIIASIVSSRGCAS